MAMDGSVLPVSDRRAAAVPKEPGRSLVLVNRIHPPDTGATGRLVADLASRLAAAGWQVTVLACGEPQTCRTGGYVLRRVGGPLSGRRARDAMVQIRALAAAIAALPPTDVLVTLTDPPMLPVVAPVATLRCGALVHWSMDVYPELLPLVGRALPRPAGALLSALRDRALFRHDAVVAVGACMAERLERRLRGRVPITVVEPWPDPAIGWHVGVGTGLRHRLLAATGAASLVVYAGTLGRSHPLGALETAVRAAASARVTGRPMPGFVFVGQGDGMAALRARVGEGLPGVVFLPSRPAPLLAELLAAADVHLAVLAAEAEGLMVPCKVHGALAAGRPVVFAGPSGGAAARRVLAGGGRVVAPDDGIGLLAAATALAGETEPARSARRERAQAAVSDLDADAAAAVWDGLLGDLVIRGRRAVGGALLSSPTAVVRPLSEARRD